MEKQNLIQQGKARVREEYEQKMKDLEVEQRVNRSKAVGDARVAKMNARDALLEVLSCFALHLISTSFYLFFLWLTIFVCSN